MAKYTPMIEQYLGVKAEVPDAFLFFRLGDFYEMFFEDAVNASRELEITLTGREGGMEERIPMCGVPYHSAENYIAKLVEKGYKVAICEQVENPAEAKGVVRREIVRIVTPGTVMDARSLGETANNYIIAIAEQAGNFGLTACDISTGELHTTLLEGSLELLLDEINVYNPSEVLGSEQLLETIRGQAAAWMKGVSWTPWTKQEFNVDGHFAEGERQRVEPLSLHAISLLMSYLQETQKRSLTHIKHIRRYEQSQYMIMDPFTRRNLELVETVWDRGKKGTLLWLLDKTVTAMGGRLLRRWIEKPLMSMVKINERLEAVDKLYSQLIVREELRQQLKLVYDLERLTARIAYGSANARDLLALKVSLLQMPGLKELCATSGSETLARLSAGMDVCDDIAGWIETAIVDEPPVSVRDGGMLKMGYHERLDQLKEANISGKVWIAELERKEREATGVKSLKIGFNKVFGYYIEVTRSNLGVLPEGRYERKQTLAGAERFVTPELKEKEALILEAEDKMVDLEYELFVELRDKLASQVSRLQQLAEIVASIDVLQSFGTVSASHQFRKPEVDGGFELLIEEGRHPVVEAVMTGGLFIANETKLSQEAGSMLLITGPNMAGKSTYMRQVAIICIMAQIGCFVPSLKARVPVIDRIFTRIGAADDLIGGQSTFMVEMMDIQVMCEKATARSLVIIDELGRGTSTGEGMAIAQAVIEHLHDKVGCKTLVSTHFHELAHLEESLGQLRNYCMAVKESGRQVTFLRKLIPGAASTSYGIYCAQIAGLPDSIIQRSYDLLNSFEARAELAVAQSQTAAADSQATAGLLSAEPAVSPQARHTAQEPPLAYKTDSSQTTAAEASAQQLHNAVQLSLFSDEQPPAKGQRGKHDPARDRKADELLEKVKMADLINMTPLQAMNFLYELKQKI
ncbi:DNA mismatch repair protein MutS [Paenibacillus thalictri]|uniref:DNA mismatch repair protein MutS n=1 Tax=Paenibacillus thalictri TaxID=2527873 RepID=A0A4Q9DWR1_9BACL|nr:DNA mismatch repair protein MutS [Paenibacillus thalictri]TBL80187.1 DNA mismatch repair protein MutS [Paenibacillus thalictri]